MSRADREMLEAFARGVGGGSGATLTLHPDLAVCVHETDTFTWVKHPLVNTIYAGTQMEIERCNAQLLHKRADLARAKRRHDWNTYVFLHERPWRAEAFAKIAPRMSPAAYWELLAQVWIDSENIRQCEDLWEDLLADPRPGREFMMSSHEQASLAHLPGLVTIWQGHTATRDDGWSWTTNKEKAVWFAHRFALLEDDRPAITAARVDRDDISAYFLGRNEEEVLVRPDLVRDRMTSSLRKRKS